MTTSSTGTPSSENPGATGHPGWRRLFGACAAATWIVALGVGQGTLFWVGLGGREGLSDEWPPLRGDHGLQYHHAVVARDFLRTTGTTAGYDPSFMAGYAMSIVSLPSSTLGELVVFVLGGTRPAFAYKVFILAGGLVVPWLAGARRLWQAARGPGRPRSPRRCSCSTSGPTSRPSTC